MSDYTKFGLAYYFEKFGCSLESWKIDRFRANQENSRGLSSVGVEGAKSRYDFNWLNVDDYIRNIGVLSYEERMCFNLLVSSDTKSNGNRFGVKTLALEDHLLLSLGCGMRNIVNTKSCPILSNLKFTSSEGYDYVRSFSSNRTVDAKTSHQAYREFRKDYAINPLFKDFVCYQAVITHHTQQGSVENLKKIYLDFFNSNRLAWSLWQRKKKKICSYLYSNEISVDSILEGKYRAHTHLIFFVKKSHSREVEDQTAIKFSEDFNLMFPDRTFSLLTDKLSEENLPVRVTQSKDIEKSIEYLFRCYSLSETYKREIREDNIRELNIKTVETYHTLVRFFKKEDGYPQTRRFNHSMIPRESEKHTWRYSFLQKKKRSLTIKKSLSKKSTKPVSSDELSAAKPSTSTRGRSTQTSRREKRTPSAQKQTQEAQQGSSSGLLRRIHRSEDRDRRKLPESSRRRIRDDMERICRTTGKRRCKPKLHTRNAQRGSSQGRKNHTSNSTNNSDA